MISSHLVFVYGSLKTGFHNHRLLIDHKAVKLGDATTQERYLLLKGSAFPFLINPEHFTTKVDCAGLLGHVSGEVYKVDDAGLARLDKLESHPEFYRREEIDIQADFAREGSLRLAWCYFLNDPSDRIVDHALVPSYAATPVNGVVTWTRDDVFDASEEA